jgi:adenine-specific DNA methylase/very-short-patch-repair endonuclease
MTDASSNAHAQRKPVFIEKIMPVKLLNEQVYFEHGGNPFKGLHRWYSRKPLSFSRASVLGSLLPGDVTPEEFEYLLGLERPLPNESEASRTKRWATKLYKMPPSPERLAEVQRLCEEHWGTRQPTVLDAFAGGGSIPFEAVRYGLRVFASDLNPVAVVIMKAAMEYPLKFGPGLQTEIDRWVQWVGDEAEQRLAAFFPSQPGETVQNYLWAHTVDCPHCQSTIPLSPNWWLYKRPEKQNLSKWCAVKPIPNPQEKRVDFELIKGKKGKGTTIETPDGDFDPNDYNTIARGVGKCPNCDSIIDTEFFYQAAKENQIDHEIYAVAYKSGKSSLEFRLPSDADRKGIDQAKLAIQEIINSPERVFSVPIEEIPAGEKTEQNYIRTYAKTWSGMFNARQLLTLVTYVEIINDAKTQILAEYELEKAQAIITYLALVLNRCIDASSRLAHWSGTTSQIQLASGQHALNLMWNYPEPSGVNRLWTWCAEVIGSNYSSLCDLLGTQIQPTGLFRSIPEPTQPRPRNLALVAQIQAMAEQRNLLYSPRHLPYNKKLVDRAKELRKNMTPAEKKLWHEYLKHCSDRFWRQRPIDHFIVDFYCPARYLVIEIDGASHDSEEAQAYDSERTQILEGYGLKVLRFTNQEVLESFEGVCAVIENPPRPPFGRGEDGVEVAFGRGEDGSEVPLEKKEHTSEVPLEKGDLGGFNCNLKVERKENGLTVSFEAIENPSRPPFGRGEDGVEVAFEKGEDGSEVPLKKNEDGSEVPLEKEDLGGFNCNIAMAFADSLFHVTDRSIDAIITDPPYYGTIQYAELSDFFYVWMKRTLGDVFPDLFWMELTDKDREAVANPSRFRNMGEPPDLLANRDYEAKMAMAFGEYYRVLRDDGVMTVQFNHKDSGAWDVLAKSLIDAGFEITASWAVSTENPQNLHQAQKNSVSSTVLLVCRKRDPNAGQAWWDDLRPEVANLVAKRAPEFEQNDITGIDLYLSAFGPALNVFSRHYPILDSSGNELRPEQAFAEARKAIANYRFQTLAHTDTVGFDPLTTWYMLAWDAFRAREFPFDDARQLALAVGGFNVADLAKTHKLIDSTSGTCKFLTPGQRFKKRTFSVSETDFTSRHLIDSLHAMIAIYEEEGAIEPVRRFLRSTGLLTNDLFMRSWEVALRVIPRIRDDRKRIPEEKALADLWLALEEIQAKVIYQQTELEIDPQQIDLFSSTDQP